MNSLGKSLSRNTLCLVIYVTITVFNIKRPEKEKGGQGQNRESHWTLPMSGNFLVACFSGFIKSDKLLLLFYEISKL
jgi:hypothetical protein